jgi:hypothetical protein
MVQKLSLEEKYARALECLRSIARHGGRLPSDGLAQECLEELGEPKEPLQAGKR